MKARCAEIEKLKLASMERYYQQRRFSVLKTILNYVLGHIQMGGKCLTILDLGSGQGMALDIIASFLARGFLIGVDLSRPNAEVLKQKGYSVVVADVEYLPFRSTIADMVLLCEVIEHLPQPDGVLFEIQRTLRKNGHLILSTPNRYGIYEYKEIVFWGYKPHEIVNSLRNKPRSYYPFHIRLYSIKELRNLIKKHGFVMEEWFSCGFCFPFLGNVAVIGRLGRYDIFNSKLLIRILRFFEKIWIFNWNLILHCRN